MISRALGNMMFVSRVLNNYRKQQLSGKVEGEKTLLPSQQFIVSYVCRHPGSSQETMVSTLGIDKTMITHILNDLQKSDYITRKVSEKDGRVKLVYPTEKAQEIYPRIHGIYETFTERVLEGLTVEEIDILTILTEKVRKNATDILGELNRKND